MGSRAPDAPPAAPVPGARPPPDPLPKMRRRSDRTRRLRRWLASHAPDALVVLVVLAVTAALLGVLDWTYGPTGPTGSAVRRAEPPARPVARSVAAVRTTDVHDGAVVAAQVAPAAETHLVVRASRGPSWVVVRVGSATGKVLYAAILQQGQRMTASAARIFLRLGAASQVDVTVNGRSIGRSLAGTVNVVLTPADR
jgi:hypothetical protein